MEANPQIPDAYGQEFLAGEAEDTAWIVDRGGSTTAPYGTVRNVLTTLEATRLEPWAYDQKGRRSRAPPGERLTVAVSPATQETVAGS